MNRTHRTVGLRLGLALAACLAGACDRTSTRDGDGRESGPRPTSTTSAATAAPAASSETKPKKRKKTAKHPLTSPKKVGPEPKSADCGSIIIDGKPMQLDCEDHSAPGEHDGVDVVPRDALERDPTKAGGMPLPVEVDHRDDDMEGVVRNQGHAGSCTSFALAAAIDHAMIRREKKPSEVSSLHLWSRFHHAPGQKPIDANYGVPITSEASWPYDQGLACEWESSTKCTGCKVNGKHVDCHQPVDTKLLEAANAKPFAKLLHVTRVDNASTLARKRILARGQDMYFGMKINKAAFHEAASGDHVIGVYDLDDPGGGGHAMLIAGYREQPDGTYFLLHNSWGTKFGDHGYAWMHESMLKKAVFLVDAVPEGATLAGASPPRKPPAACGAGQVPDAATDVCAATCPDGSARFEGVCVATGSCEEGEVSVRGECVPSAPTVKGAVTASKVDFDCHPGGCVYVLPKGHASCESASCAFSCAAPAFVLEAGKDGVFCSE